jgi:F-type H+-transporting ATPase subunit delta
MNFTVVAARYARALAGAIHSSEEFQRIASELQSLARLFETDPFLRGALENPALPRARRLELIGEIVRAAGLADKTKRFLELLEEHGRFAALGDIAEALSALRDEREGIVQADLTTAVPLDEALSRQWEATLGKLTGRTVRLKKIVDPAIIGGAVARIGSTVYDGSLKSRIGNLRQMLTRS